MSDFGLTLFDTAIGRCGLAWGPRGIVAVQLPEANESLIRSRLLRKCPDAIDQPVTREVAHAITAIIGLLRGEKRDLLEIAVDETAWPEFNAQVYDVARRIFPGETLTYGEVASRIGAPDAARAVGQALGQNPVPIIVPCHRVLAANGGTGGFSAPGGITTKFRMLQIEGAKLGSDRSDDAPMLFEPELSVAPPRRRFGG
jgi:methylated-DNA-[protein]-cysteine S-methyltransferase